MKFTYRNATALSQYAELVGMTPVRFFYVSVRFGALKKAANALQAAVPDYMIPFVPILQDGEPAFSMFLNVQTKYHWVVDVLGYNSSGTLIEVQDDAVINPALKKRDELEQEKMRNRPMRHVDDYRKKRSV
jgi:hypothetical protein